MGGAVRRGAAHPVGQLPVRPLLKALKADGAPRGVEAKLLQSLPVIRVNSNIGVEREAIHRRTSPLGRRRQPIACWQREARPNRARLQHLEPVRWPRVLLLQPPMAYEQPNHASGHLGQ
jgi:hypothetical protein